MAAQQFRCRDLELGEELAHLGSRRSWAMLEKEREKELEKELERDLG